MFNGLPKDDLNVIIDAMEVKDVPPGLSVITEGREGQHLYMVKSGVYECFKAGHMVKTYNTSGEIFGELALLYGAQRAASIICKDAGQLYSLDRPTFNMIVKDAASKRRNDLKNFLDKLDLFKTFNDYEKNKIADGFKWHEVSAGTYIITEGEQGDKARNFYIIEKGSAYVTTTLGSPSKLPIRVKEYSTGDYFGEKALMQQCPRAANVIASSDCQLLSLDRKDFKWLLGPINEILNRIIDQYNQINMGGVTCS
jgi:cAMP-dependent protein kinase regulator